MKKRGFTLIELLVVVLIVGILVTITIPNFGRNREGYLDNEALVNLKEMHVAQRFYFLKMDNYYNETDIDNINFYLKLELEETNWDYSCNANGCVQATRTGDDGRSWRMRIDEEDPLEGATCP